MHNDYADVVLRCRLRDALAAVSPDLLREMLDNAFGKLTLPERTDA